MTGGQFSPKDCETETGQSNFLVHFLPVNYGGTDRVMNCTIPRGKMILLDAGGWLPYEDSPEYPDAFNRADLPGWAQLFANDDLQPHRAVAAAGFNGHNSGWILSRCAARPSQERNRAVGEASSGSGRACRGRLRRRRDIRPARVSAS